MNLVGSLHAHQGQEYAVGTENTNSNVGVPTDHDGQYYCKVLVI